MFCRWCPGKVKLKTEVPDVRVCLELHESQQRSPSLPLKPILAGGQWALHPSGDNPAILCQYCSPAWRYPAPQSQPCPWMGHPLLQQMPAKGHGVEGLGCSEKGLRQLGARSWLSSKPRGEAAWAETLHSCRCSGRAGLCLCALGTIHPRLRSNTDVFGSSGPHH